MLAAAAGSVGGAVASGLLVNQSMAKPETIALVMATTGGVGAYLTEGNARVACAGAAAAGAGQLALAYMAKAALHDAPATAPTTSPPPAPAASTSTDPPRKSATGGGVVSDMFRAAVTELDDVHESWRYRGDAFVVDEEPYRDDGYGDVYDLT